jgi:hypothetical protein
VAGKEHGTAVPFREIDPPQCGVQIEPERKLELTTLLWPENSTML